MVSKIFADADFHSHMPFIFEGSKLLHCRATYQDRVLELEGLGKADHTIDRRTRYQAWRIYVSDLDGKNLIELEPDLAEASISCSPFAWRDEEGLIHLNYVSCLTLCRNMITHRMWERVGPSFSELGPRKMIRDSFGLRVYSGFDSMNYRAFAQHKTRHSFLIYLDKNTGITRKITFSHMKFIKRIAFCGDLDSNWLITFPSRQHESGMYPIYKTVFYDVNENIIKEIKTEDDSVYKSSIFDGIIVYAKENSKPQNIGKKYDVQLYNSDFLMANSPISTKIEEI